MANVLMHEAHQTENQRKRKSEEDEDNDLTQKKQRGCC